MSQYPEKGEGAGAVMDMEDLYRLLRNGHVQAQGIIESPRSFAFA